MKLYTILKSNIRIFCLPFVLFLLLCLPIHLNSKVVKIEITNLEVVSDIPIHGRIGDYEVIKGIIYLEVDPDNPANAQIVDLNLAKRDKNGNIGFSTEFELHKPVNMTLGNRRLLYFVNNRGNKMGEWHFNHEAGKNWLYSEGWSYLWCGWNCDVIVSDRKLNIFVPVVYKNDSTITGKIYSEIISYSNDTTLSLPIVWGGSIAYPPVTLDTKQATLTKRQYRWNEAVEIPHDQWSFAREDNGQIIPDSGFIYIKEGFIPGWLYDLVYEGKNPKLTGLGMAAIRDVISFFKYERTDNEGVLNPFAGMIEYAYAWGHSQSGRLLNHFVYQNFNSDEKKRMVLDGIIANCPGGGKGLFNSRFAQTTRHGSHHEDNLFPVDFFPFTSVKQVDPLAGNTGDACERARESGFLPKMFFINSSTDYWTRAASLLHTDVKGEKDLASDPSIRIYAIAGLAHTASRIGIVGRALLTALDQWVSYNITPPPSQIPTIKNGTLVSLTSFSNAFPRIPGVNIPPSYYHPYRLNMGPRWLIHGIADHVPPKTGSQYVCLIPQVDKDGNEIAGIRLPEIAAPLATYTGWSLRTPSFSHTLRRNAGRVWPFSATEEEREKNGDPRLSILERYPSKKDYLHEVTKSLLILRNQRFILDEDFITLLMQAAEQDYWPVVNNSTQIAVENFSAQPSEVEHGQTTILTVQFTGQKEHIIRVKAIVREAPHNFYIFNDRGIDGDILPGDFVWASSVYIFSDARPGEYHIDLQVWDRDWNPVDLKNAVHQKKGKTATVVIKVK